MKSVQNSALTGSLDETIKAINLEISKPIPGSTRVSETAAEDEMALFMSAQAEIK